MCRVVTLLVWLVLISSLWRLEPLQLMSKLTTWRFVWNCLDSLPISLAITLLNLVFKDNYLDTLNICCNPRDLWYSLFTLQIQKSVLEWVLQKKVNLAQHNIFGSGQHYVNTTDTLNTFFNILTYLMFIIPTAFHAIKTFLNVWWFWTKWGMDHLWNVSFILVCIIISILT